jgi:cytochrome c biogenesis factor
MFTKRLDKEMTLFEALNIIVIGNCANLVLPFRLANKLVRGRLYPPRYKDMSGRKKYIIVSFFLSDTICIFITAMLPYGLAGLLKTSLNKGFVYVLCAAFILLALILIVISFITSIKGVCTYFCKS